MGPIVRKRFHRNECDDPWSSHYEPVCSRLSIKQVGTPRCGVRPIGETATGLLFLQNDRARRR